MNKPPRRLWKPNPVAFTAGSPEGVISNDEKGNIVDQQGNIFQGSFDGQSVTFTGADGAKSVGAWMAGTPQTAAIRGGGKLTAKFCFTFYNPGEGQALYAQFEYCGSLHEAARELKNAGFHLSAGDQLLNFFQIIHTPNVLNFRTKGDPKTGRNSSHAVIHAGRLNLSRQYDVPVTGNIHTGETNPHRNLWEHLRGK